MNTLEELHQIIKDFNIPENRSRMSVLFNKMEKSRDILCSMLPVHFRDLPIQQLMFHSYHNIQSYPECPECKKSMDNRFISFTKGYGKYCSLECSKQGIGKIRIEKRMEKDLYFSCSNQEFKDWLKEQFPRPGITPVLKETLKKHEDWDNYIGNFDKKTLHERIYFYINDIKEYPICICGKELRFKSIREGFVKFCSSRCTSKNYHDTISKEDEATRVEKQIQTFKFRHGKKENPEGHLKIQEKIKDIYQERWGTDHYMKSPEGVEHLRQKTFEKTGYTHPMKNPNFIDKRRKTGYFTQWKEKMEKVFTEKYGVKRPYELLEFRKKSKTTMEERYGVRHYAQAPEFREKAKNTFIEKYGVDNPWKVDEIQQKAIKTSGKLKEYILSNGETVNVRGYDGKGYDWLLENGYNFGDIKYEYEGETYRYNFEGKSKKYIPDFQVGEDVYEVKSWWTFFRDIEKNLVKMNSVIDSGKNFYFLIFSGGENPIRISFENYNELTTLAVFDFLEVDISEEFFLFTDYGILFPLKGAHFIYHNNIENEFVPDKVKELVKDRDRKLKTVVIFNDLLESSYEKMKSRVLNLLGRNLKRVYARKCVVKEIESKIGREFIEKYHMQGYASGRSQKFYGLYLGEELLSVMQFGRARFKKEDLTEGVWELLRFCNLPETSVIGGASKIFEYFKKSEEWTRIISYADSSWSSGEVYIQLGFRLEGHTNGYWYLNENLERLHRAKFQKYKLVEMGFDKEKTERQITEEMGLLRFEDLGNWKFVL